MPFWPAPRTHDQTVCFTCKCSKISIPSQAQSQMHPTKEHIGGGTTQGSQPPMTAFKTHQLQLLRLNTRRPILQDLHSHLSRSNEIHQEEQCRRGLDGCTQHAACSPHDALHEVYN